MEEAEDRAVTLTLVPEWFGGDLVSPTIPVSAKLRVRLRAWNRVWETVLDPVTEIRWPDPKVGRAWIAEGHELVRELQAEVGSVIHVVGGFERYDPDTRP